MTTRAYRKARWEEAFLHALRKNPNATKAAAHVGIGHSTPYERAKKYPPFAKAWEDAIQAGVDHLWGKAHEVAEEGDPSMLRFLLSRLRPERFGDKIALEHTGSGGGAVVIRQQSAEEAKALAEARRTIADLEAEIDGMKEGDSDS